MRSRALELEISLVDESVVSRADHDEIARAGASALPQPSDVMNVEVPSRVAARHPATVTVASENQRAKLLARWRVAL